MDSQQQIPFPASQSRAHLRTHSVLSTSMTFAAYIRWKDSKNQFVITCLAEKPAEQKYDLISDCLERVEYTVHRLEARIDRLNQSISLEEEFHSIRSGRIQARVRAEEKLSEELRLVEEAIAQASVSALR